MTTIKLSGDFGKLQHMVAAIADPGNVLRSVSKNMAEEAIDLVKDGYRTETDPYGDKWAPKQANDGRKTLSGETSRLKGGWKRVRTGKDGFVIEASVDYGLPHQDPKRANGGFGSVGGRGRLKRPRRMQVPDETRGMPAKWGEAISEAALEAFEAAYGGGRTSKL